MSITPEKQNPSGFFDSNVENLYPAKRAAGLNAFLTLRQEAKQNGVSGLSLDEINKEIDAMRNGKLS